MWLLRSFLKKFQELTSSLDIANKLLDGLPFIKYFIAIPGKNLVLPFFIFCVISGLFVIEKRISRESAPLKNPVYGVWATGMN